MAGAGPLSDVLDSIRINEEISEAGYLGRTIREPTVTRLISSLAAHIYAAAHAGMGDQVPPRPAARRDESFESELASVMPCGASTVRHPLVRVDPSGSLIADIGGVHVRVPSHHRHLGEVDTTGLVLHLPTYWTRLSPGFFLVDSPSTPFVASGQLLRLYLSITSAEHAIRAWKALGNFLPELSTPWRAKVLSSRIAYPRNDAIVIYVNRAGWPSAALINDFLRQQGLADGENSKLARRMSPWDLTRLRTR